MRTETASIIIPTYNEAENIEHVVDRILSALEKTKYGIEILVMDDDSPDGTWKKAQEEYQDDSRVHVVRRREQPGLSMAVSEGFIRAAGEFCAVIDADLQHPPERLPSLIDEIAGGADVAIGSRHIEGGGIENWSSSRKVISKGAGYIAELSVPSARNLSDPMSGFFAVRRSVVDGVLLEPRGYKILLELLAKCDVGEIVEVPYVFKERERGESKLTLGEYQNFAEHILGLSLMSHGFGEMRTPMRMVRALEFAAVGGIGTLVNILVFWLLSPVLGVHYLVAGAGAFFAAVNWNFIGNWAITFNRPKAAVMEKMLKFYTVSIIGYLGYSTVLALLVGVVGLPEMVANVGAIISASVINFLGTDGFVFDTDEIQVEMSLGSVESASVSDQT